MSRVYNNYSDIIDFTRASTGTYLDSDGVLKTASVNVPRVEYDADGNLLGLLVEEQRTNLLTYSEQFDNAAWSKGTNVTVTPNYAEAPDGTISADRIVMPDDIQTYVQQVFTKSSGATYTAAIWARATSGTDAFVFVVDGQSETKNVTEVWQLFTKEVTATSSGGAIFQIDNSVTMDILFWGAQLEAGQFPTSYIKTEGATATRSADVASIDVTDFGYNQSEGSVVVNYSFVGFTPNGPTGFPRVWSLDQTGGYIAFISNAAKQEIFRVDENNNETNSGVTLTTATLNKTAISFESSNIAITTNGATVGTSTSSWTLDPATALDLGGKTSARYMNGHIKSIKYYPRRLTNSQLQDLTS